MSVADTRSTPAPANALGLGMATLVVIGVILLLAGFIALGAVFDLVPLYAGFLLLWHFSAVDDLSMNAMPALFLGALCGTLTAWLLQYGLATWGQLGTLPGLAVIVAALFCQLMGRLPIVINRTYMLYVTVMAAPLMQMHERFDRVVLVVALATIYFGGIVVIGRKVIAARQARRG